MNKDYLVSHCSPITMIGAEELYVIHFTFYPPDSPKVSRLALQYPSYEVILNVGFTDEEVAELISYAKEPNRAALLHKLAEESPVGPGKFEAYESIEDFKAAHPGTDIPEQE